VIEVVCNLRYNTCTNVFIAFSKMVANLFNTLSMETANESFAFLFLRGFNTPPLCGDMNISAKGYPVRLRRGSSFVLWWGSWAY